MRIAIILSVLLLLIFASSQAQELTQNEVLALEVIGRLNDWRLDEGVWPLKPNDTLTDLAVYQASYLSLLPDLPDDLHIDSQGREPRVRAIEEPWLWPHYQLPGQVAIGENAGVGTVEFAMDFWQTSPTHTRTALNPAYREVGVAVLPYKDEYIFIAVFGGRPNVLPALLDPRDGQTIYLTNETFEQAQFYDAMQSVTEIQLFDADGRPIHADSLDWTERIAIAEDVGDEVFLLMNDADDHTIISGIDLDEDRIILPDALPVTPTVEPTTAPETEATPAPEIEATPQPTLAPSADPDMVIVYNADTLDVINTSGALADWRALEFVGTIGYPFTQWERVTVFPLGELPVNHCLQIRSLVLEGPVVVPESCGWVRSLIQVPADKLFWTLGDFEVRRNGATLATCVANAGRCEVVLP